MRAILVYGATGYSGRLIAHRAYQRWSQPKHGLRLIVAGRDGRALRDLAGPFDVEYRTFTLDQHRHVVAGLHDVFAVINAAGPFALTANPLALAALDAGCHYVDINGEVDVYKRLDDLGYLAEQRGLTMVCGAGHSAVASELLLEGALRHLKKTRWRSVRPRELGAVRIALSQVDCPSRGSIQTTLRTVREQVLVVRDRGERCRPRSNVSSLDRLVLTYVPLGQLERVFDFGAQSDGAKSRDPSRRDERRSRPSKRIACAVNLIDTLAARLAADRHVDRVLRIESYLECSEAVRATHQLAALTAPYWWIDAVREFARRQVDLLPEGPTVSERARGHLSVVLEIDDAVGHPIINWRLETPSAYDFTACSAVAVAERLPGTSASSKGVAGKSALSGWRTPAEFLVGDKVMIDPCTDARLVAVTESAGRSRSSARRGEGCRLYKRTTVDERAVSQ